MHCLKPAKFLEYKETYAQVQFFLCILMRQFFYVLLNRLKVFLVEVYRKLRLLVEQLGQV